MAQELIISELLVQLMKEKCNGKIQKLEEYITTHTNVKISRYKLENIINPLKGESTSLSLQDLEAIDKILGGILSKKPILKEAHYLTDVFKTDCTLIILLPTLYNRELKGQITLRWHLQIINAVQQCKEMQHVKIQYLDVIKRKTETEDDLEKIRNRHWYKTLEEDDNPKIAISHPFFNNATEMVLGKIFDVEPYADLQKFDNREERLPLYFHWPKHGKDRQGIDNSSFHIPYDRLKELDNFKNHSDTIDQERRCIILNNNFYVTGLYSDLKNLNDHFKTYGLLILRRCTPKKEKNDIIFNGNIHGTIIGTSGPAVAAIAERIFNNDLPIKVRLPTYEEEQPPVVLIALFEISIGISNYIKRKCNSYDEFIEQLKSDKIEEWRKIIETKIIDINLWTKKDNVWRITEEIAINEREKCWRKPGYRLVSKE